VSEQQSGAWLLASRLNHDSYGKKRVKNNKIWVENCGDVLFPRWSKDKYQNLSALNPHFFVIRPNSCHFLLLLAFQMLPD